MALPRTRGTRHTLLDLGLRLRCEHSRERREHVAHLAGRLGYRTVWLPVDRDAPWPDQVELARLAEAAEPAALGLIVGGDARDVASRLQRLVADRVTPALLVDVGQVGGSSEVLRSALGGDDAWWVGAVTSDFDEGAAGWLVSAPDRAALLDAVAAAARARVAAGRAASDLPITVEVTVSIGRTRSEAEARAVRDPHLAGAHDPRHAGLFGTLEEAQQQLLDLARAGADAVRATLADENDVADLLAQLRAVAVGPTPVLHARGGR